MKPSLAPTLTPPVRRAGRQKFRTTQQLADAAKPFFERLMRIDSVLRVVLLDLKNRSPIVLNARQALIFVLGCNGFSHAATADSLRMNESTCVYIFRRSCQRYIDDVDFRELCNRIAYGDDPAHVPA
jgi:G:T-mismatch repair DNA endonuclease (very short patch repair protein)